MSENQKPSCLTAEQRAKIENNRLTALERKRTRENKRLENESIRAAKQGNLQNNIFMFQNKITETIFNASNMVFFRGF